MKHTKLLGFGLILGMISLGCDSGGPSNNDPETGVLILTVNDLRPLPGDYHLEAWITTSELTTASIGKFTIGSAGKLLNLSGEEIMAGRFEVPFAVDSVRIAYITIEPPGDADTSPSNTRLMGGLFVENTAELRITDVEGIEDELILARGNYIVETPTNGSESSEQSGIWFVNLTAGPPARGLQIKTPIPGWKYQAWTDADGIALNMGIITNHSQSDDSNIYSGPQPGYNFPGEDFLVNAPDDLIFPLHVGGARVTVSLEPDPDPDPGRSQFILLENTVPESVESNTTYGLINRTSEWPTATIFIR